MKKKMVFAFVSVLAVAILLPATSHVNKTTNHSSGDKSRLCVDGNPIPPMPPHTVGNEVNLEADGNPIPPMPPHAQNTAVEILADGNPIPPMPPRTVVEARVA
jgi:hypothetical protein